ncbi:MAG: hypothetical protein COT43_02470 [Candidatus Marinimicrobia bacterium CG08_land_8_20_14_0_20_45_22]|nr:MAG: hypothetical protein COT43_02470 [Candidatus Marinimicrobia bacterium CG08_land_8_20_14_0_20_45_22]
MCAGSVVIHLNDRATRYLCTVNGCCNEMPFPDKRIVGYIGRVDWLLIFRTKEILETAVQHQRHCR